MKNQKTAYIFVSISIILWSTVASAFKLSLRFLTVMELLFYSTLVSTLSLFLTLIILNKKKLFLNQTKKDYLSSAILGLLNPLLYYIVLFQAYDLIPAQQAQTLNYTWAIVLALLSVPILKETLNIKQLGALLISFCGVVIIATKGNIALLEFSNLPGVILAVSSSLIWALYWLINIKDKRDPIVKLFTSFIFGSIYTFLAYIIFNGFRVPDVFGILGASYVGLFEMGITFVFWIMALSYSENSGTMGNYIYLSPFLSLLLIYFILGEEIHISSIAGLVLIISGVLLQQLFKKRPRKKVIEQLK